MQGLLTHCACTCRACFSVSIETLRAVARACWGVTVWLHRMWCSQCVSNRLLWRLFFLCTGRCGGSHKEGQKPPSPKGWTRRSRRTVLLPTTWAHMQKESRTLSPTSFAFRGSRGVRSVSPRTRVSCLIKRQRCWRVDLLAGGLEAASLNASAASESTSKPVVLRRFLYYALQPGDALRGLSRGAPPLCSQRSINSAGDVGPLLPLETRAQKKGPATNGSHPGRRNLHEQPGSEPSSGETARDKQGDTSER